MRVLHGTNGLFFACSSLIRLGFRILVSRAASKVKGIRSYQVCYAIELKLNGDNAVYIK